MPSIRTFAFLCGGSFAALLIVGWGGNILLASGIVRDLGALRYPFLVVIIGLLAVFAISAVPLMVGAVLGFQRTIGNENVRAVRTAVSRQNIIVFAIWGLIAAGGAIAIPAAIMNGALNTIYKTAATPEARGPSQGMLVAAPGMTFAEMALQSTLKIEIAARAPITSAIGSGSVFDYRIPGTGMLFHNCRYYFVSPYTRQLNRIEAVNVGLSPHTVSRSELEHANTDLRAKLAADGWLTGHEKYRDGGDRTLHGGVARGPEGALWLKKNMVLSINMRRMDDAVPGEDANIAGQWIQFISLWSRSDYPSIERYVFAPAKGYASKSAAKRE